MSADRLRAAASLLRERAEAATPGPWIIGDGVPESLGIVNAVWFGNPEPDHPGPLGEAGRSDAAYIATMAPPVARALAGWLDAQEDVWSDLDTRWAAKTYVAALAVADAILGPTS